MIEVYRFVSLFCFILLCLVFLLFALYVTIENERRKIKRAFSPSQRNDFDVTELHEITVQCLRTQVHGCARR